MFRAKLLKISQWNLGGGGIDDYTREKSRLDFVFMFR
jgi:hypothetical protein